MHALMQDVRYGWRMLLRQPGFTTVAVIALALGIGANTALFSVVNAILLRPIPFTDPERIVLLWGSQPRDGWDRLPASYPNYRDWTEASASFEASGAFFSYANNAYSLTGGREPERVQAAFCTTGLFDVLAVRPEIGRLFGKDEDRRGGPRVALISHGLWVRHFASDPAVAGRAVRLDGETYTIVGVMPAGFAFPRFPKDAEVWLPLSLDPNGGRTASRGTNYLTVLARLGKGVSLASAQGEMDSVAARLAKEQPRFNARQTIKVAPLQQQAAGDLRPALLVLLGAVGFVLLIACANVANLMLSRAVARRREIAIRGALGAGRPRLVRQFLTESVLLSTMGGAAGLLVSAWGTSFLASVPYYAPTFFTPYRVGADQIRADGAVFAFSAFLSMGTGIVFGIVPAIQAASKDLHESLKEGASAVLGGKAGRRARAFFAVTEVALSLVLLTGAGLMIRSFARLARVDPGFDAERVMTLDLSLPRAKYTQPSSITGFYNGLLERVRALPGVTAAAAAQALPLSGSDEDTGVIVEGYTPAPDERPHTHPRVVSAGYFKALGIPVVRGREFGEGDVAGAPRVAVVSEEMAKRFWPGQDPIGRRVALDYETMRFYPDRPPVQDLEMGMRTIVGVVSGVHHAGLDASPPLEMYAPLDQAPQRDMSLVVRAAADAGTLAAAVRKQVQALDRDQAISAVRMMDTMLADSIARPRFNFLLLGLFAALALVLAAVGLYGVISHSVVQRTHEIGVRVALGARAGDILGLVLREGARLALYGIALGLLASFLLTRWISVLLYDISATDPTTFLAVSLVLAGVALSATFLPARRALRVDPMVALRAE